MVLGIAIRRRNIEASTLRGLWSRAVYASGEPKITLYLYGNSIHELICITAEDTTTSGSIKGEFEAVLGQSGPNGVEAGLWIDGEKIKLGDSILIALFSSDQLPVMTEIPFSETQQILEDSRNLAPHRFIQKWAVNYSDGEK